MNDFSHIYKLMKLLIKPVTVSICCFLLLSCSHKSLTTDPTELTEEQGQRIAQNAIMAEHYQQGVSALSSLKYSEAEKIFREFISKYPDQSGAYSNLALIQFKLENHDESLQLINKAIELSNNPQAYNLRAQLKLKAGKIHQAKEDYRKAIEIKADYLNAHYNLALLYDIYLQDIKLAIQHYEIYLSLLEQADESTREWVIHLKNTLNNG